MRRKTLDEIMEGMDFKPSDTGPNVTELRKVVQKQMENGLIDRSAGTWTGVYTAEERAAALLEVENAIAAGQFKDDCPPMSGRPKVDLRELVATEPPCSRCKGQGWLDAIEGSDGSYVTSRPCPKCHGGARLS
jgi:hypothetical protein